jgi:uncharacterized protein (DUF2141 family)
MAPLEGGAKDVAPPVMLSSNPPDRTTGFSGDRIVFEFDEYIQLKNASQKLLISPPMNQTPELRERNKTLTVVLKTAPDSNTTYTLNFADGIADLNEGNAIQNFTYTFSTGQYMDSLQVAGKIIQAYTLEPAKDMSVFLYSQQGDSLPYTTSPYYVTRTDAAGNFRFLNMRNGRYTIAAISDKNNNYRYDPPEEHIAFLSEEIVPFAKTESDTSVADTLPMRIVTRFGPDTLEMFSFSEKSLRQKISKSTRTSAFRAEILFSSETPVKPGIIAVHPAVKWNIQYSYKNDSLIIWAPDTISVLASDTLRFVVRYGWDSLGTAVMKQDTLKLNPLPVSRKPEPQKATVIRFSGGNNSSIHPLSGLYFESPSPITGFSDEKILLSVMQPDSQYLPVPATFISDTLNPCRWWIKTELKPESKYRLKTAPGFLTPSLHALPDSMEWNFATYSAETYGNLKVIIAHAPENSVFVLTDEKGNPRHTWQGDTAKDFHLLPAARYKLMLFIDENGNGRWDGGMFLAGVQPEKVFRYEKEISIRANWDLETVWTVKEEEHD